MNSLVPHLAFREKWARPTDCLYELHAFAECGAKFLADQQAGGVLVPKQFGLVVDHSRLQPVVEIKQPPSHPSVPDPNRLPKLSHACDSFIERMRQSNSRASMLVGSAEAQASLAECITSTAVSSLPASSGSSSGFASIDAYRKTLGDPLLLTVNRWPAARFVSALEQFSLPTRLGLPCSKVKRMEGGECHGHTCERDFAYSWRCLNESATRTGMLAVHMRCLQARPKSLVEGTEAQIDALRVMEESLAKDGSGGDAASAEALRNARELLVERAKKAAATGHVSRGKVPTVDGVKVDRMPGCGNKWNDRISDARYVQDAVANTLGWPPGGAQPSGLELLTKNPTPLFDGWKNMLTQTGGDEFAFRYLGAIARHFDLVLVNEYMDESLLLLAKREKWPLRDILYLSQKRRKRVGVAMDPPAAQAALSADAIRQAWDVPSAELLRQPDKAWLWPHELDSIIRANWIDTLLYMYQNHTLWRLIDETWPKDDNRAAFRRDLAVYRRQLAAMERSCARCERLGEMGCLQRARRSPRHAPPHFCWQLRQDTTSWTEHFFSRSAMRFDATAATKETNAYAVEQSEKEATFDFHPGRTVTKGGRKRRGKQVRA